MKPLSIKIENPEPFSGEEVVKKFQEHCFQKGVYWYSFMPKDKIMMSEGIGYIIDKGLTEAPHLYFGYEIIYFTDFQKTFTLPAEWKEFTDYLNKYIAFHKPEPKEGEYWIRDYNGKNVVKVNHIFAYKEQAGISDTSGDNDMIHLSHLERPATPEEIAEFKRKKEETDLIREAKRIYKEGDKLRCAYSGEEMVLLSVDSIQIDSPDVWASAKNNDNDICLYDAHTTFWAEKVEEEDKEKTKDERIKELEEALSKLLKLYYKGENAMDAYFAVKNAEELLNKDK